MSIKISKHIKNLNLTTRRKVYSLFLGNYRSIFKGQGIDFEDLREYVPGDNIKDIDWNATARSGTLYVRKYIETKELRIVFAVDTSSSMNWSLSDSTKKSDVIINFMLLISFAALRNSDRFGAAFYNESELKTIPLKKGRAHMIRMLDETYYSLKNNYYQKTNYENVLNYLLNNIKKRVICFFISDNFDLDNPKVMKLLKANNKRHELTFIHINDLLELIQNVNIPLHVKDIESGKSTFVRFNDSSYRKKLEAQISSDIINLNHTLKKYKIDMISLSPKDDVLLKLIYHFKKKALTASRHFI